MKTLKFTPKLCERVMSGEKTSTWRLLDDKDLQVGDKLDFVNKETGESIGSAEIIKLKVTTLGELTEEDWVGHERYNSEEEMYETYQQYYGNKVTPESELKIIDFTFQST